MNAETDNSKPFSRRKNNELVNSLTSQEVENTVRFLFTGHGDNKRPDIYSEAWYYRKIVAMREGGKTVTFGMFKQKCSCIQRKNLNKARFKICSGADYTPPPSVVPIVYCEDTFWFNPHFSWHYTKVPGGYPRVRISPGIWVTCHSIIYRWYTAGLIPVGLDVSHITDQPMLADPRMLTAETGPVNRARTACQATESYLMTHPRSRCGGTSVSDCLHPHTCPDACMHEVACRAPIPIPNLMGMEDPVPPFQLLSDLREWLDSNPDA
jgi:hypothetical protein